MVFKRTVLASLSVLLTVSLVAGCSSKSTVTETGKPAASSGSSESSAAPNKLKDLTVMRAYHGGMEQFKGSDSLNDNKLINILKQKSGYNVKYDSLPKDNASQKISIILASGDVPDIMWISGKSDYFKLAQQGAFEPLDDMIKKYIPNLSSMITDEAMNAVKLDGKVYGIPVRSAAKVGNGVLARSDIMKELNLKEPTTLEEFYTTMKTIKEKKNIAPLTFAASNPGAFSYATVPYAAAFGVGTTTIVKNGKLEFSWLQPEYKEFLTTMKKWYDEGLLDQEFAINKDIKDKMINGTSTFSTIYWGDALAIDKSIKSKNNGGTLQYIAPPVGKNGQSGFQEESISTTYIVIPKQAKNKQGAAEYINYIFNPDTDKFLTHGIEGQDYKVESGEIVQTPEQSNAISWRTIYFLGDTDISFSARLKKKGFLPYYEPLINFKRNREETVLAPSIEAYDSKFAELLSFSEENSLKFIMGKRDLSEFDKFVQEFNAKGGKPAMDAMNDWFTKK